MRDTNYFTLQGSMDGDLTSFMGSSQYSRASLSGNVNAFKASLYLSGANHGQLNTVWGRHDNGQPFKLLFDARRMIEPDAQRRIAKVYLSAFLQLTLQGGGGYRPLFEDARNAGTATYRINLRDSEPAITAESSLAFGASNAAISSLPGSFHPKGVKLTSGKRAGSHWTGRSS